MNKHYRNALVNQLYQDNNAYPLQKIEALVDGSDALTGNWEEDIEELQKEWEEYLKYQPIEEMLDQLKVGFNVTPFGFGFVKDEEDLKALKAWIKQMFLD